VRIENPDNQREFVANDSHWLKEIGVVGDEHRSLVLLSEAISQQVRGDVYVRPLLFRLDLMTLTYFGGAPGGPPA
jgi:hypothetical protein